MEAGVIICSVKDFVAIFGSGIVVGAVLEALFILYVFNRDRLKGAKR